MATYTLKGRTNALAYQAPGMSVLQLRLDLPDLIANPDKVALSSAPTVGLTSFSGLAVADVFQLFQIPAGTLVKSMGMSIVTAETLAATIALGDGTSTAGFGAAKATNAVGSQITLVGDAFGPNNTTGKFYVSADTLDALVAAQAMEAAVIDFWAEVLKVN